MKTILARFFWIFLLLALLAGCQGSAAVSREVDMAAVLKTVQAGPGGWQPTEALNIFTKDTLYDLMNGQSDAFFVYGFQRVGVQRFQNADGAQLIVSVFQVDTPASAYGLFSVNRDPQPLELGNDGSTTAGQRISYWQERYFVQLTALKPVDDANLRALGKALSAALPQGGERPALLGRLPQTGLAADPAPIYFHEELSIQDRVFLGGDNMLGLGQDTGGVIAQYDLGGQAVWLMLIEFPSADRAAKGLEGLKTAQIGDLQATSTQGKLLAAVFGAAELAQAETLVNEALK